MTIKLHGRHKIGTKNQGGYVCLVSGNTPIIFRSKFNIYCSLIIWRYANIAHKRLKVKLTYKAGVQKGQCTRF